MLKSKCAEVDIKSQEALFSLLYNVTAQRGEQNGLGYRYTECNKLC